MLRVWRMLLSWDIMCSVELTSSKEKSSWLPYLNPKLTVNKENRERICEITSHLGWTFNVSIWKIVGFSWLRKRSTYLCALKAQCPGIWPVTLSELQQRPGIQHVLTWPVGSDHWCQVKEWPFYHPLPRLRKAKESPYICFSLLQDICEDISDHVEQIHALLETEFSLKLLSYSVNVIVDIHAVQLLWHQLRVSVLVLRERILQGLQDANGNYTRQTDILQAFSEETKEVGVFLEAK